MVLYQFLDVFGICSEVNPVDPSCIHPMFPEGVRILSERSRLSCGVSASPDRNDSSIPTTRELRHSNPQEPKSLGV